MIILIDLILHKRKAYWYLLYNMLNFGHITQRCRPC
ncbi:unnamed protein product [Musa acuminata subsp. malaccensis]|nr:unnamed protein product [Musa acuminata subsp. malaccensis]